MAKKWKTVTRKMAASEAFEGGKSDLEGLLEEMGEWMENLSSNNMEHLPKYEEVEACNSQLEEAVGSIDSSDWPEEFDEDVEVSIMVPYKGRGEPRWMRRDNACACLYAAKDSLENANGQPKVETDDAEEEIDEDDVEKWEFDDLIGEIDNGINSAESADFPSMM